MTQVTLLCALLLLLGGVCHVSGETRQGPQQDEMFRMCDLNSDGQIAAKELKKCSKFTKSKGDMMKKVFTVFDKDQNGFLSAEEYGEFVSMAFEGVTSSSGDDQADENENEDVDEEVEVIDRSGKKKVMKRSEFNKMNEDKMKGLSMEDGEMTKMEQGETTMEKAQEENPELARVLAVGKWIQSELASMNYSTGSIVNMKTIDTREEGVQGQKSLNDNSNFNMKFEVKIKSSKKKMSKVKSYEVWVERNKDIYIKPHLAITKLWELYNSERKELKIPEPQMRAPFIRHYVGPFVRNFGTPLLFVILGTVLWSTFRSCGNIRRGMRSKVKKT